jgi:hypothetical protein
MSPRTKEKDTEGVAHKQRIAEVRRIFEEYGFGDFDLLERWEGDDLRDLCEFLSDEEYQTLLDELQEHEE